MTSWGPSTQSESLAVLERYYRLPQGDNVQAMYIWIDGDGGLRSKSKTLVNQKHPITDISQFPEWNYDGSSTGQASGKYSEVLLIPVRFTPDPFRGGNNVLVLCEALEARTRQSALKNNRSLAMRVFSDKTVQSEAPWYGIEQEYILTQPDGRPLGFPESGFPAPQGPYYCSVGTGRACGRHIAEAHYRACLYCGLSISGTNAEVMCGQWEYQIGPVQGIDAADQLWISRYLMHRVAEDFGVKVSFAPKLIKEGWNGSGCHTNYSTKSMRQPGGYQVIVEAIGRLEKRHAMHMTVYGEGNQDRLVGKYETANYNTFSYGVAHRGASIRIPNDTKNKGFGYFEDRRPASNMDPYLVTSIIAESTILNPSKSIVGEGYRTSIEEYEAKTNGDVELID